MSNFFKDNKYSFLVFLITLIPFSVVNIHQISIYENMIQENPDVATTVIVSGDEPWYLALTSVIIKHGSVYLDEHYLDPDPDPKLKWTPGFLNPNFWHANYITSEGHYISGHGPGTSFLLIPGYALAGVFGSMMTISIISSSTAVFLYKLTSKLTTWKIGFLTTLIFSFSTLFFIYSNRIYPEPIVTLAAISILYFVFEKRHSTTLLALSGAILGFLPFLKMPYVVLDFIIIPFVFVLFLKHQIKPKSFALFCIFFVFLTSLAALNNLLTYENVYAGTMKDVIHGYTNDLGSNSESFLAKYRPAALIAMFFDKYHGLFVFSPVTMLFVLGMKCFWNKNNSLFIISTLVSISLIGAYVWINPAGIMGGYDPPSRYISPIILLMALPFAFGLHKFSKNWIYRIILVIFITIGFSFSLAFSVLNRLSSLYHFESKGNIVHTIYQGIEFVFPSLGHDLEGLDYVLEHQPLDVYQIIFLAIIIPLLFIGLLFPFLKDSKLKHQISS